MEGPARTDELHEQARQRSRERLRRMNPGERMEEAYRLFALARRAW